LVTRRSTGSDQLSDLERTLAAGEQQTAAFGTHGVTLRQALKSRYFWTIASAFFLVSIGIGGTIPNLIPMLQDGGLAPATAASVVGAIGLSVIFGRIIAGYLIDRLWAPGVAFVMLSLPAVSCLILAGDVQSVGRATIAAAIIGLAAGAEFDLISYLTSRYFGLKHYGKIYVWQFAAFSIGAGLAPPVFGRVFDLYASYRPILIAAAILYVLGSATLLTLGKYPNLLRVRTPKQKR
jgi:MFS family permease